MMTQDSTHPTGVADDSPNGGSNVATARGRKAEAALALRKDGEDWDTIAEVLGYPTGRAALVATEKALQNELKSTESRAFVRRLADDRLTEMLKSVYKQATNPDHPDHLAYLREASKLIAQHADLLGAKAPAEFSNNNPSAPELEKWVAQMLAQRTAAAVEANIFESEPEEIVYDEHGQLEAPSAASTE